MRTDKPASLSITGVGNLPRSVGALRLLTFQTPEVPQRRHLPRRRVVAPVAFERRCADRRQAKPGVDGLMRMVLADDWT